MSVRCFVAIELPSDVRTLVHQGRAGHPPRDERWRDEKWVPHENLHVTLKFVGHIAEDDVDVLVAACIAGDRGLSSAFELAAEWRPGTSRAPTERGCCGGRCRTPAASCASLPRLPSAPRSQVGVAPETRAFKPHVTLVRARAPHVDRPEALDEANR